MLCFKNVIYVLYTLKDLFNRSLFLNVLAYKPIAISLSCYYDTTATTVMWGIHTPAQ